MDLVLIRREGVKNLKIIAGVHYGCTLLNWKFKLHYHLVKRLQRLFCEESVVASIFSYDCSLHRTIAHYKTLSCSYSSGL